VSLNRHKGKGKATVKKTIKKERVLEVEDVEEVEPELDVDGTFLQTRSTKLTNWRCVDLDPAEFTDRRIRERELAEFGPYRNSSRIYGRTTFV